MTLSSRPSRFSKSVPVLAGLALAAALVAAPILRQPELIGVGVALLSILVLTIVGTGRDGGLVVNRSVPGAQLSAGETARVSLTIANRSDQRRRAFTLVESVDQRHERFRAPALAPGESTTFTYDVIAQRRGVLRLGPVTQVGFDPFGLLTGSALDDRADQLIVRPRVHPMTVWWGSAVPDLDGPTSDLSPQGGAAFHTLQEYELGDDLRLVHWQSSARLGELVVRRNVDPHRPVLLLLLDTRAGVYAEPADFEEAVEIAASVVVMCSEARTAVALAVESDTGVTVESGEPNDVLAQLALVEMVSAETSVRQLALTAFEDATATSLVIVTGAIDGREIADVSDAVRSVGTPAIMRIATDGLVDEAGRVFTFRRATDVAMVSVL